MRKAWMGGLAALAVLTMAGCPEKKPAASTASVPPPAKVDASAAMTMNLVGTEWRLEDLGGAGVIDNSQATLAFPEAGRVAGNGSCNRFMGQATIAGSTLKLGPMAGTRMACASEAVSDQEMKYLKALEGATRYEWKDPYLLIYCDGLEKPLRFTKAAAK